MKNGITADYFDFHSWDIFLLLNLPFKVCVCVCGGGGGALLVQ